ncbi:MAG: TrbC/VirB2 family protein [Pseudomonadota bacterium]
MTLYHQVKAINQTLFAIGVFVLITALFTPAAYAAGSGMPWEGPLQNILDSVSGPVAQIMGAITIILTGLAYASGEGGAGMRKLIQIVFGLSIAFTASSFFLGFFSFSGGATI